MTLNAGTLNFIANPGTGLAPLATSEKSGPIILGPGQSTIQAGYTSAPTPGTTSVLTAASLVRIAGGTVNFVGNPTAAPAPAWTPASTGSSSRRRRHWSATTAASCPTPR